MRSLLMGNVYQKLVVDKANASQHASAEIPASTCRAGRKAPGEPCPKPIVCESKVVDPKGEPVAAAKLSQNSLLKQSLLNDILNWVFERVQECS
jgi:hypothetical protein